MLPYYFAGGHVNYARYGMYYLRNMENLPTDVLSHFLKGHHVTRHIHGVWNAIWTDQFIETTFMKVGKSTCGIIGVTLKPKVVQTWALSRHISGQIETDLLSMEEGDIDKIQMFHQEESKGRIQSDAKDRLDLRVKLETCIHPLNADEHPDDGIINIVSGKIAPIKVNVDNVVAIGEELMKNFEESLPKGFYQAISKKVITLAAGCRSLKIGDSKVYDLNAIYSRVIALLASDRDMDIKDLFSYELSPVPASMFTANGMRICKAKANLKRKLQSEVSQHDVGVESHTVIDGSALLWTIHWPEDGTVGDFVENVKSRVAVYLAQSDVYLIFDRYQEYSIKSSARDGRETGASKKHHLLRTTKLPSQKSVLCSAHNKKQLIEIIFEEMTQDRLFHLKSTKKHTLIVTGQDPCPIEVKMEDIRCRHDMTTYHEEADIIIVSQVLKISSEASDPCITVVSDDTDVFILLLHHYHINTLKIQLVMQSPIKDRTIVDIQKTVSEHKDIVANILPAHALTGCDTVAAYFGIGKGKVKKLLKEGYDLSGIGHLHTTLSDVINQATKFIAGCYGVKEATDMSDVRVHVWGKKNGKGHVSAPNLAALPPTMSAFTENVKRAHFQSILWRDLTIDPRSLNPETYGWTRDEDNKAMTPTMTPESVKSVPEYILETVKCGCKSATPCSTKRCGCKEKGLSCTIFCACHSIGCSRTSSSQN